VGVEAFIFDLGWGELIVIGVVALIAIGPKELPGALRTAGQWMGKLRRMAAEFQNQFQEAMREAEVADLKQHFDAIQDAARDIRNLDPVGTVRERIESAAEARPMPSSTATDGGAEKADCAPEQAAAAAAAEGAAVDPAQQAPEVVGKERPG
jgi:sec-independent protein translocase protein TatB